MFQGRVGVAIFSLVTGYVCALKPIRQCRAGQQELMMQQLAKSAFRRVPRLILPATIATVIIWFVTQFGVFEVANRVEGWWLNYTSPNMTPYIGQAVIDLILNCITTWTKMWNVYDKNQWTLLPLLKGSMTVYMFLVATAYLKPRFRMMASFGFYLYYYIGNERTSCATTPASCFPQSNILLAAFGMQFFFGVFLSDLSQSPTHITWCQARKWPQRFLAPLLILIGLLLASYPEGHVDWAYWSTKMGHWSVMIFPTDNETPRAYSGLGLNFVALGIHFSPSAKDFLSNRYLLYFGKNSFAVYLLHGSLLRTILVWMYYGFSVPADIIHEDGKREPGKKFPQPSRTRFFFWLPIWFVILYTVAHYWTKYVDPLCARLTERWVKYTFETPQTDLTAGEKPLLPHATQATELPK
jgi:peptidoglycan/LPS O-acetylase OafA/YrhL